MNAPLIRCYHALPDWARPIAAFGRGAYLSRWRYGHQTESLLREALSREYWTFDKWKQWQAERLAAVLRRAVTYVPFYRDFWAKQPSHAGIKQWEDLANWPILEKEEVRRAPRAFVAEDCNIRWMFPEHTSGTSGKPLTLWRSRKTQLAWYALQEARVRHWHLISRHDRWAILGGQLIVPASRKAPPFWVWNSALHQLYMSSFHLSPEFSRHYLDALTRYEVKYLLGYSSALEFLARETLRLGRMDLKMTVVIANAEPVSNIQRTLISQAFQCPLRDTYGMAEMVAAASECSEGCMHLWPEVGLIEVRDDYGSVPDGVTGELICTGLLNDNMPLIRYRVGDRGAVTPAEQAACACGRLLPSLTAIEGRSDDVLHTADGRQVGRLDSIFKGGFPIVEAQLIQEALDCVRIRFVPSPDFSNESALELTRVVKKYLGPMRVLLESVDQIPREPNGKFRAVISNLQKVNHTTRPSGTSRSTIL